VGYPAWLSGVDGVEMEVAEAEIGRIAAASRI
jgi:hypothetical protein